MSLNRVDHPLSFLVRIIPPLKSQSLTQIIFRDLYFITSKLQVHRIYLKIPLKNLDVTFLMNVLATMG
jgi:hypothetical protein